METSAVSSSSSATTGTTTKRFQDMESEDFFALLIAELQSQDPMNPTDNQQLLNQMSTIRQMEQSSTLNETLTLLASEQRFGSTSSLIGHYISGTVTDTEGTSYEIQGLVIGVRFESDGGAILELHNGNSLPASKVDQVTLVENLPDEILEQLEAELGLDETEGDDEETDDSTARSKRADALVQAARNKSVFQEVGTHADGIAELISAMASSGVSVGV